MRHTKGVTVLLAWAPPLLMMLAVGLATSAMRPESGPISAAGGMGQVTSTGTIGLAHTWQLGGRMEAIFVSGHYAFAGVGPRLAVLDVSDPGAPRTLGLSAVLPGVVRDVRVADGVAYLAASEAGLWMLDIRDPAEPRVLGALDTPGSARRLDIVDGSAYVADGTGGLRIVNVRDPAQPRQVGAMTGRNAVYAVSVVWPLAYVGDEEGFYVVDVADSASPRWLTRSQGIAGIVADLAVADDMVYAATRSPLFDGTGTLQVVSVANLAELRVVARLELPGNGIGLDVVDGLVYVASSAGGLRVVDARVPGRVRSDHVLSIPGDALGADVSDGIAFVAGSTGVHAVGIQGRPSPSAGGTVTMPGNIEDVAFADHLAFVAGGETGLHVVDWTDRDAPLGLVCPTAACGCRSRGTTDRRLARVLPPRASTQWAR